MKFAIKSQAVLLPKLGAKFSELKPAVLHIRNEKIVKISDEVDSDFSGNIIDVGSNVLMPGICDSHVHMNEPGRTEWEGIETASRAAAAGGITTLVDMPLNSIPPTTTVAALELKRESAKKTAFVDYGFWGGVIPGNFEDLGPLIQSGVLGFKTFMIDSGVSEFPMASDKVISEALPVLAQAGVPLLVHAELESDVPSDTESSQKYSHYLASRPQKWELDAIQKTIQLAQKFRCRVHIVHLSAAEALELIRFAKSGGVSITAETCPHYLSLFAEDIQDGATHFKCAPPIRERKNREELWGGLESGVIDFIVSDHSPCTPKLKKLETGDFDAAWGGIAGLQFSLPVVWTEMSKRGLGLEHLSYWMAEKTTQFLRIRNKSGRIEVGSDADFVVFDSKAQFELQESQILHKHRITPYLGKKLQGIVKKTFVRGYCVYNQGQFFGPLGKEVARGIES